MTQRQKSLSYIYAACIAFGLFIILGLSISTQSFLYSGIEAFDTALQNFSETHTSLAGGQLMIFFTSLADTRIIVVLLFFTALLFIRIHEELISALLVWGLAVGAGVAMYIKDLLLRPRPMGTFFDVYHNGSAFPSAHALVAVVFYGFIAYALAHSLHKQWQRRAVVLVTSTIIFLIGYSRVYLGVHWASDVIGGWLLGTALLLALVVFFRAVHVHAKRS
jgi:undecaprenyl-diphosphatase